MKTALMIAALLASVSQAQAEPSLPECSAALFKVRDIGRAMSIGMLGYAQWNATAPQERASLQARFKAEREEAMNRDTSDIVSDCKVMADRMMLLGKNSLTR